jgi:hypothetical protein
MWRLGASGLLGSFRLPGGADRDHVVRVRDEKEKEMFTPVFVQLERAGLSFVLRSRDLA